MYSHKVGHIGLIAKGCSNRQYLSRIAIEAIIPLVTKLDTLFFLIYISALSDKLPFNIKLFADDTSLFCLAEVI